jgi:nucleotide-binding universal stress UspA family protein
MFSKIFVPLDGSSLGEQALPLAVKLALLANAELVLFRAVEKAPKKYSVHYGTNHEIPTVARDGVEVDPVVFGVIHPSAATGEPLETVSVAREDTTEAENYLTDLKQVLLVNTPLTTDQIKVRAISDQPADEIGLIAQEIAADLIVMSTHGRTGFTKMLLGSIATKTLQTAKVPVILVRPENEADLTPLTENLHKVSNFDQTERRVVVALDGSLEAEKALNPAIAMAKLLRAKLYLLKAIPLLIPAGYSDTFLNYADEMERELEISRNTAYTYLESVQAKVAQSGVECLKIVREGNPAEEIVNWSADLHATLVVMATHARGRVGQFLLGSIADSVLHSAKFPLMLVHR